MSNRDPRLASSSSATPPSVPVSPNKQAAVIIQLETSVLSGRTVYKLEFEIDTSGKPVILSHSVALSAGKLTVNPSEGNNGEPKGTAQTKENHIKQSKAQNMFKTALTDFVKEGLEEIRRFGQEGRFFHDIPHQSAMDTRHAFFRYGRENPDSQGQFRSGATYGYNDCHLKDPGRNQCNRFLVENFVSQEQIIYEDAALHNAPDLCSFQRWASNNNSDKSQSTPAITASSIQK
ncbi:hypothetical protein EJB05_04746, partial [Eragrostis curvula]